MPNTREKLIESMNKKAIEMMEQSLNYDGTGREMRFVGGDTPIIANGVTVQKWIPVTEQEEPTENGTYLCHGYWFGSGRKQTETADFFGEWNIANNFILTHWMPLPEPPKGE